jgi:hypothetical protein
MTPSRIVGRQDCFRVADKPPRTQRNPRFQLNERIGVFAPDEESPSVVVADLLLAYQEESRVVDGSSFEDRQSMVLYIHRLPELIGIDRDVNLAIFHSFADKGGVRPESRSAVWAERHSIGRGLGGSWRRSSDTNRDAIINPAALPIWCSAYCPAQQTQQFAFDRRIVAVAVRRNQSYARFACSSPFSVRSQVPFSFV